MNLPAAFDVNSLVNNLPVLAANSATFQAVLILFFLFFMAVFIALSRRILIRSSMKGLWAGFVFGIIAIAGLEGGLVYVTKNVLGTEKAQFIPPSVKVVLTDGQKNLNQVLGVNTERQVLTAKSVVSDYNDLDKLDSELVRNSVCKPIE